MTALTTLTWTTTNSGSWTTASNWSPNQVPGAFDDALINVPGAYTISVGNAVVQNITLNDPSATFSVFGGVTVGNRLVITSGTVQVQGGGLAMHGLSNTGTLIDNSGSISIKGQYDTGSVSRIGGTGSLLLGGMLDNTGRTLDGATFKGLDVINWGTIEGGTIVHMTGASGTLDGVTWQGPITQTSSSTLVARYGLVVTGANGTGPGTISNPFGAFLQFQGSSNFDNATIVGAGQIGITAELFLGPNVVVNTGTPDPNGPLIIRGTGTLHNNATVAVGTGAQISVADFENSGSVTITGTVLPKLQNKILWTPLKLTNLAAGLIQATGGTIDIADTTQFLNNGTVVTDGGFINLHTFIDGTGVMTLTHDGSIEAHNAATNTETISFMGTGKLILDQPTFFQAQILGFSPGDYINMPGQASAISYTPNDLKMQISGGQTFDLAIAGPYSFGNFAIQNSPGSTSISINGPPLEAPILIGGGNTVSYISGGTAVAVDPALKIVDSDSITLAGVTVKISQGHVASDGDYLLASTTGTAIKASYNGPGGILTLTGVDTIADYQHVLDSVVYGSINPDPTNGSARLTRTVDWIVNDGSAMSGPVSSTVNIQPPPRSLTWSGQVSGDFNIAANWSGAKLPPNDTDTAQFFFPTAHSEITGVATVRNLNFTGTTNWLVSGASSILTATNGVIVGPDSINVGGNLTIAFGAKIRSEGVTDTVSSSVGTTSTLIVRGGSAWRSNGELVVGNGGYRGTVTVEQDGTLSSGVGGAAPVGMLIADTGGSGSVTISGTGATLGNVGGFVVGNTGLGSMTVSTGGHAQTARATSSLAAPSADIAAQAGSDGSSVGVSGVGSNWQVTGVLIVGDAATGFMNVTAGGLVTAGQAYLGEKAGGSGNAVVAGTGSTFRVNSNLVVGDLGTAGLSILNHATVSAANVIVGAQAGGSGNVDVEGAGSLLNITNNLTIGAAGQGVLTLGKNTELTVGNRLVIGAKGALNNFGGAIDPTVITILAGGREGGSGTTVADQSISNAGTVFAASGIETINAPLISTPAGGKGVLEIDAGGDMVLNVGTVDVRQSVIFADGTGILTIGSIAGFGATIQNVIAGDEIIVQGNSIAATSFNSSSHVLTLLNGSSGVIGTLRLGASVAGAALQADGTGGIAVDATPPAAPTTPDLMAAWDSGVSSSDNITKWTTPVFVGKADVGSKVTLYDGASVIGGGKVDASGSWMIMAKTLAAGVHSILAQASDAAGNVSTLSSALSVTIDPAATVAAALGQSKSASFIVAPGSADQAPVAAPTTPDLMAAWDSGSSWTDNITKWTTPAFTGKADAGSRVTLYDGASVVGAGKADASGAWMIMAKTLSPGVHSILAQASDAAGNISTFSNALGVTIDTTPPSWSTTPDLMAAWDSGSYWDDNLTKWTTPVFTGKGDAGSTVTLYDGATVIGTGKADASGAWMIMAKTLTDGVHTIKAPASDIAGNISGSFSARFTIDSAAPSVSVPDLWEGSDTGTSSTDNVTKRSALVFTGKGETGTTVTLYEGSTLLGTGPVYGSGNWTIWAKTLTTGVHAIKAQATDAAGNVSALSNALEVTIDTTAPAVPSAPDLMAASDSGASSTDNITKWTTPVFTGKSEAGSTVTLSDFAPLTAGTLIGTGTADASGVWTITAKAMTDGVHAIRAQATDAAGNGVGAWSNPLQVTIDTAAPAVPSVPDLMAAWDSGSSSNDNVTKWTTPVFTGKAEAASQVTLYDSTAVIGTGTADASGAWTIKASVLADGVHAIQAQASDPAGNVSALSAALSVTIDPNATAMAAALGLASSPSFMFAPNSADPSAVTMAPAGTSTQAGSIPFGEVFSDTTAGPPIDAMLLAPDSDGGRAADFALNGGHFIADFQPGKAAYVDPLSTHLLH